MSAAPSLPLSSESELQQAYAGEATAARYVEQRFVSELHRLLHDRQVAAVQSLLNQLGDGSTLEIAPGPGRVTRDVRPRGPLTCLEFNEGMLKQGHRVCGEHVQWVQGNAFELPWSSTFDLVYSFRFVRHFRLGDRHRLYAGIHRALKPGGRFLFDAVNEQISRPLREANPQDYPIYDELYSAESLQRELASAGFRIESLVPVQKWCGLQDRIQVLVAPRWQWLSRVLIRGVEKLPRRNGLEWIVTCVRE